MAIYWFGTEDIDFPEATLPKVYTTAGMFRSHLRCGLYYDSNGIYMRSTTFESGELTSAWMSYRRYDNYFSPGNASNAIEVGLGSSGTNKGIYVGNNAGYPRIVLYDGGSQTVLETGSSLAMISGMKIDLELISYGASGTVNVYVDGSLQVTYTGDITISGVTGFDCVVMRGNIFGQVGHAAQPAYFSEIIVADQDTRSLSVVGLWPTADGSTNSWTGGYTNVDEATLSDVDLIYTNTHTQTFQCNLYDQTAFPVSGVLAVKVAARGYVSTDSALTGAALGIQSGSTISMTSAESWTDSWQTYEYMMTENPVTGNAFQLSELDDLQITIVSAE